MNLKNFTPQLDERTLATLDKLVCNGQADNLHYLEKLSDPDYYTLENAILLHTNGLSELIPSYYYSDSEFLQITGITKIPKNFLKNSGIDGFTIPKEITEIEDGAFSGCMGLEEITFEKGCSLKRIGKKAFSMCASLVEIFIPGKNVKIEDGAFCVCPNLSDITFEYDPKKIPTGAFLYCGFKNYKYIHE